MPEATASAPGIEIITDVECLPWRDLGQGLLVRTLRRDPRTGARTSMVRMVPQRGYVPPREAHYHLTYEEILGLRGQFTFDARHWLGRGSYVFHPPGTVHGFASQVPVDSVFLSRVGAGHSAFPVSDPEQREMYPIDRQVSDLSPAIVDDPVLLVPDQTAPLFASDLCVRWYGLRRDPDHVYPRAVIVRIPAGWMSEHYTAPEALEILVLDGVLDFGEQRVGGSEGGYVAVAAGAQVPPVSAVNSATIFIAIGIPSSDGPRARGERA